MKKPIRLIVLVFLLFTVLGCSFSSILGKKTATPTSTPTNTATRTPTATAIPPTATNTPTNTPTEEPKVTVRQFEQALKDAGYRTSDQNSSNKIWTLNDPSENIYTSKNGQVTLEVMNNVNTRISHMERYFVIMDGIFPSDFMTLLRDANDAYAASVGAGVSGDPVDPYGPEPGDDWKLQWGYYNVSDTMVKNYEVRFELFFLQLSCPEGYICSLPSFSSQQFTGEVSITQYEVNILLER
jgi:hypothetical protein